MLRRHFLNAHRLPATVVAALPARAQAFPSRPIRMVVPFPPGGPTDAFARLYAEALCKQLGQTVIVDNKAGASGAIGMDVKNSAPDGYTLLFGTASTHALYNLIESKPRYDATPDFDYVAVLGGAPVAFAVAQHARHAEGFIASKKSPGKYNYGSPGTGTLLHVATERLLQLTGATHPCALQRQWPGDAGPDGRSIEMAVGTVGGMLPLHKDGRLRWRVWRRPSAPRSHRTFRPWPKGRGSPRRSWPCCGMWWRFRARRRQRCPRCWPMRHAR